MALYDELPSGKCAECGKHLSSKTARGWCDKCHSTHKIQVADRGVHAVETPPIPIEKCEECGMQIAPGWTHHHPEQAKPDPFNAGRVWEKHYAISMDVSFLAWDSMTNAEQMIMGCHHNFLIHRKYVNIDSFDETIKSLIAKGLIREVVILCK